jgi:hypothetical protein
MAFFKCRTSGRWLMLTVATTSTLQACSLFDPYVKPKNVYLENFQGPAPTQIAPNAGEHSLEAATAYGEALREEYFNAISDQAILNSTAGLALIPISAAGLYFGISGPQSALLPTALGGAAMFLGANYLHSQPREYVYAEGADAVSCAVIAMAPVRAAVNRLQATGGGEQAKYPSLSPLMARLQSAADQVEGMVKEPGSLDGPGEVARARVAEARALIKEAVEAETTIQTSGDALFNAIQKIRTSVTNSLIADEPNLTALASSLSSALPLSAGQLVSKAAVALQPSAPPGTLHDVSPAALKDIQNLLQPYMRELNQAYEELRGVVALVRTAPSQAYLDACGIDVKSAGLNFSITPDSPIAFSDGDKVEAYAITISGGKPQYDWAWQGLKPDDLNVALTYGADGTGVLTITETTAIPKEGSYQLQLRDTAKHLAYVNVKVNAQTATKKQTGSTGGGSGSTAHQLVTPPTQPGLPQIPGLAADEVQLNVELMALLVDRKCMEQVTDFSSAAPLETGLQGGQAKLATKFPDLDSTKVGPTLLRDKLKADKDKQIMCTS